MDLSEDDAWATEHKEEDGEEETEAATDDDFVHDGWNKENQVLRLLSANRAFCESDGILENIVVEELMDNNIPLAVITSEIFHVPPVLIELSVSKGYQLWEHVHPRMQDSIE